MFFLLQIRKLSKLSKLGKLSKLSKCSKLSIVTKVRKCEAKYYPEMSLNYVCFLTRVFRSIDKILLNRYFWRNKDCRIFVEIST